MKEQKGQLKLHITTIPIDFDCLSVVDEDFPKWLEEKRKELRAYFDMDLRELEELLSGPKEGVK